MDGKTLRELTPLLVYSPRRKRHPRKSLELEEGKSIHNYFVHIRFTYGRNPERWRFARRPPWSFGLGCSEEERHGENIRTARMALENAEIGDWVLELQ